jgi:hypothetical protein
MTRSDTVSGATFNPHGNVTADGVLIVERLRVFTNNLDTGYVSADRDADRCCGHSLAHGQMRVNGGWFTDHRAGDACPLCRHNHWFTVTLDKGGAASMDGERLATTFNGRKA